jgi:hypothetical protein
MTHGPRASVICWYVTPGATSRPTPASGTGVPIVGAQARVRLGIETAEINNFCVRLITETPTTQFVNADVQRLPAPPKVGVRSRTKQADPRCSSYRYMCNVVRLCNFPILQTSIAPNDIQSARRSVRSALSLRDSIRQPSSPPSRSIHNPPLRRSLQRGDVARSQRSARLNR